MENKELFDYIMAVDDRLTDSIIDCKPDIKNNKKNKTDLFEGIHEQCKTCESFEIKE